MKTALNQYGYSTTLFIKNNHQSNRTLNLTTPTLHLTNIKLIYKSLTLTSTKLPIYLNTIQLSIIQTPYNIIKYMFWMHKSKILPVIRISFCTFAPIFGNQIILLSVIALCINKTDTTHVYLKCFCIIILLNADI